MNNTKIPEPIKNTLEKKFKIIDTISFLDFDYDFSRLIDRLSKNRKKYYAHNEKILIVHVDTDYYFEQCTVGVNLRNFFEIIKNLDISPSLFIFYTAHYGIEKEIDILCKKYHKNDRPFHIDGSISFDINSFKYKDVNYNFEKIKYNALCMMNEIRSHRSALYNAIKDIDSSKITIQITNKNNAN